MHPSDNTEALLRVPREPRRNNYFYGKRMDVQHFQMEQNYGRLKQWLLNRLTLGKGVLCGLGVSMDGGRIRVGPGVAIDGLGREIIVPRSDSIDPLTQDRGCCVPCSDEHGEPPTGRQPALGTAPGAQPGAQPADGSGIFTLWLCYRECKTDYQPVLVSDCATREQCAAGTIVESYCLKVTAGEPPLQGDPEWCAKLWAKEEPKVQPQPSGVRPSLTHLTDAEPLALAEAHHADPSSLLGASTRARVPIDEHIKSASMSRRRVLCELFSEACDPPEGDPCVPLAVMQLRDKRIVRLETCLVRPRVYSNAVLLDLILCLADKIEECCDQKDTPPPVELLRVRSVEFLGGPNNKNVIATVQSPLAVTPVPVGGEGNAIRMKFTQSFDQAANVPTTPGLNDANFKRHNVLVLPEGASPVRGLDYVPGTLTIESPDTLRWDLSKQSPFWLDRYKGWRKATLRLVIFGESDAATSRRAISDTGGKALDGEPIPPASGAMSGNGVPGGIFTCVFRIG